ncbi:TBC1 domain family member 9B-like [Anarrhichthys ocellatus]|uniref:TBC1 domain family member 9B-like n=1 Tax=Anarrhichthys ocellatus TaxID=433405 RepID=UPI0012EDF436|nr:TBC1 domain family member 9B-like [Anarrhichthys ocellatus]XP_031698595.1 TBC1 domain family member 9B-like [Anarrhichthys ocellatus]
MVVVMMMVVMMVMKIYLCAGEEVKDGGGDILEKKEEKVKDYRYYLRMWAKEKEPKTETIKDLPRMNQEQFIDLCKTLYNMFSEDLLEQQLYHSIATVASLLLRIGEVGKKFNNGGRKTDEAATQAPSTEGQREESGESQVRRALADAQLEPAAPDEEIKDDTSLSSYSVVSSGSLQCDDIADDTVLIGGQRQGSVLDVDWSITFEQVLASLLTEPPLVDYFEKKRDFQNKMAACKAQRAVERQTSSASDHELASSTT